MSSDHQCIGIDNTVQMHFICNIVLLSQILVLYSTEGARVKNQQNIKYKIKQNQKKRFIIDLEETGMTEIYFILLSKSVALFYMFWFKVFDRVFTFIASWWNQIPDCNFINTPDTSINYYKSIIFVCCKH